MLDYVDLLEEIDQPREARSQTRLSGGDCVRDMKHLSRAEELCGLNLIAIDESTSQFVSGIPPILDSSAALVIREELQRNSSAVIVDRHPDLSYYGMRIPGTDISAGGVLLKSDVAPPQFSEMIHHSGRFIPLWEAWCHQHSGIRPVFARRLLAVTHLCLSMELLQNDLLANNSSLVSQLGCSYETMNLIADLPRQFRAGDPPSVLADAIIHRVQQICETDWSACCLNVGHTECWQLHGDWGMTGDELGALLRDLLGSRPPQIVVRNQATCPQLRRQYPRLRSLVAVPLTITPEKPSWLIVANPLKRPELGTEEAQLLKAVGHLLAGQIQHIERIENEA